jgi:2'-5' RNA ligase
MLDCEDFKNSLKEIQNQIDKEDLYNEEGYGLETEPHITVLYGIHEQDPVIVKQSLDLVPVEYELTGLSLFENEKYDVLKCTVESEDLKKLNKKCCELLEFTNDYPDYIPHLTVAYLNPGMGKKYLKMKSKGFGKLHKSGKFIFSDKESNKKHWTV